MSSPQNRYKVCVYAICKNEGTFVDRWMDSMREADLVVVTDTGSEDDTVERLLARGAQVHRETVSPWRFDVARNLSLDHLPPDMDICVCTDLDEVFQPGWRAALEAVWTPGVSMAQYLYNWSLKPDGTPDVQFHYFKAHARAAYRWKHPVHECLRYVGHGPERKVFAPGMVLNHYPDPAKSRGSYLPLLELAAAESPQDDRMAYYLGREYMYKGMWEKCIQTLKGHLALPSAAWREERCASMRWIARSYGELGEHRAAFGWYFRAIAECPGMREPYVECAKLAYRLSNWEMTYLMATEALKIKEKSKVYVNMGYSWDHTPDDLAAIGAYRMGMYQTSLEHARAALSFTPGDMRLQMNLRAIEERAGKKD